MAGRQDFESAEWQLLCQAPTYAGLVVSAAQRGGVFWEALSIARTFSDVRLRHGQNQLVDEICAERPLVEHTRFRSADELRKHGLDHIRRFLVDIGTHVAHAYPDSGDPVSAAERDAIAEITAAACLAPHREPPSSEPPSSDQREELSGSRARRR